jgi:hypothetical protein
MVESKSVQRRQAIQRSARLYPQGRLRKLAPEVRRALETKSIIDVKDIDSFVLGFVAGRLFQHEQVTKLLCPACMDGSPIVMQSGVPVHELPKGDGIWRKKCDASMLDAFKP